MIPNPDLSAFIDFKEIENNIKRTKMDEEYISQLLELANNGNVDAQFYLAQEYLRDSKFNSTTKSQEMAFDWYIKAAENGHIEAQEKLALLFKDNGNIEKAIYWYTKSAQFSSKSQYELALIYSNPESNFIDFDLAFFWCKKASDTNLASGELFCYDTHSMFLMSKFYEHGIGTPVNFEKAFIWCHNAASNGNKDARLDLPRLFNDGIKVEKKLKQYEYWKIYKSYLFKP
ncbi:tetratricopeptide repeat protein [Tolumonas lignilytica]|uniref:tetratricopeptide repeat protein n=1 Tax=Tolumonas lignilytica TaxID=1283284 RepID=UPI0004659233|nr:tetratricopeptide repeat protein [Tolumonas lignilytica]